MSLLQLLLLGATLTSEKMSSACVSPCGPDPFTVLPGAKEEYRTANLRFNFNKSIFLKGLLPHLPIGLYWLLSSN